MSSRPIADKPDQRPPGVGDPFDRSLWEVRRHVAIAPQDGQATRPGRRARSRTSALSAKPASGYGDGLRGVALRLPAVGRRERLLRQHRLNMIELGHRVVFSVAQ
jgi:hypothetical protein